MPPIRKVAIFGAPGAFGRHLAKELIRRSIDVRVVSRSGEALARIFGTEQVERHPADVRDPEAAARAAEMCDLIVHAVGLPYGQFKDHPAIARGTAEAVRRAGIPCVLISSFYSYEPILSNPVSEEHPRNPVAFKCRMRKEQEEILLDCGAAVLHLPDFYGPLAEISFGNMALRAIAAGKPVNWIGSPDTVRQFILITDAVRRVADMIPREELLGRRWNVATTGGITGREFCNIAARLSGRRLRFRTAGANLFRFMGMFNSGMREMVEMVPLYSRPPILDSGALDRQIGPPVATPYEQGIQTTLRFFDNPQF